MAVLNRSLPRGQTKTEVLVRLRPVLFVTGAAIIIIAALQLVQNQQAADANFKIQRLEQQKLELETGVRQIEAEVASLSSLARIESEGERLGLGPPQARESANVNVALPEGVAGGLPSRFAPKEGEQTETDGQASSWWEDLLKFLPFN